MGRKKEGKTLIGEWKTESFLHPCFLFMWVVSKMFSVLSNTEHEPTKGTWSPPQNCTWCRTVSKSSLSRQPRGEAISFLDGTPHFLGSVGLANEHWIGIQGRGRISLPCKKCASCSCRWLPSTDSTTQCWWKEWGSKVGMEQELTAWNNFHNFRVFALILTGKNNHS